MSLRMIQNGVLCEFIGCTRMFGVSQMLKAHSVNFLKKLKRGTKFEPNLKFNLVKIRISNKGFTWCLPL